MMQFDQLSSCISCSILYSSDNLFISVSHTGEVDSCLHHLLTHLLLHGQYQNSTNSLVLLIAVNTLCINAKANIYNIKSLLHHRTCHRKIDVMH